MNPINFIRWSKNIILLLQLTTNGRHVISSVYNIVLKEEYSLSERTRDYRLTKDKYLINKLKHQEEPTMLTFLSNEKNIPHRQESEPQR